jgi:hypothetical protein
MQNYTSMHLSSVFLNVESLSSGYLGRYVFTDINDRKSEGLSDF